MKPTAQVPKEVLEKVHSLKDQKRKIAAINPETGEWFLGEDLPEAVAKGREKCPGSAFHVVRVGSPTAYRM